MKSNLLALSFLALALIPSGAANYFVDYSGGSDTNSGTSTNAPWQHCPGDSMAAGNPASAALHAGDVVNFKAGESYVLTGSYQSMATGGTEGIMLRWDGITYNGSPAGWGTGRAMITDNAGMNQMNAFLMNEDNARPTVSNVVFENLIFTNLGGGTLPPDPGGNNYVPNGLPPNPANAINSYATFLNITISNCYFGSIGYWENYKPVGAGSVAGNAVYLAAGATNLAIVNCEFTQVAYPVNLGGSFRGVTISNCFLHDAMIWGVNFGLTYNGCGLENISICDNVFSNAETYYSLWSGYGGAPHQDVILFHGDNLDYFCNGTNVDIYNNLFEDITNIPGGTGAISFFGGESANVYNNIFSQSEGNNGQITIYNRPGIFSQSTGANFSESMTNFLVRVLNNTFCLDSKYAIDLGGAYGQGGGLNIWMPNGTNVQVLVENNILYDVSIGQYYTFNINYGGETNADAPRGIVVDYNDYTMNLDSNPQGYAIWQNLFGPMNLAVSQRAGWDTHSQTNAVPLFVYSGGGDNGWLNNYHLQANSPCIGAGVNLTGLSWLPGITSDFAGNPRSATGSWDVGAYASQSSGSVGPLPPTELRHR